MFKRLFRRSVISTGLIGMLAAGMATPSQACCFFNLFHGWGHTSYYGGPSYGYYQPSPMYAAPSGCNSCGYGPVMYGGGCATGNCGVGACGTESVTYESPSTGETKKEPVAPEEMEPIRSRNENNTPPNTYSPPPEPGLPSGESDWEETDDFRRNDILGEDEPLPNPGSNNSPGLGIDPLPETEETFNPNLDGTEPAVEPMPPLDESTPAPADQPNNRLFDDNPFGTSTTPNTDSETERRVGRPEGPAPAETESTIPAEEAPDEETEATDESPAGAPLPMPEEIESETDELPSEDVAPENPASLENLRPTGLDSRISLNAPVRTRSGKATSSRVNIPEVVRKPSPQKTLTKNGNKPQRLVSR